MSTAFKPITCVFEGVIRNVRVYSSILDKFSSVAFLSVRNNFQVASVDERINLTDVCQTKG